MKLKKIKFGFTLVEALVIMTIAAILLAAATPLITRKVLKPPKPSLHGRYEAYFDKNGTPVEKLYYGEGDDVSKLHVVYSRNCTKDSKGNGICKFEPPVIAETYTVQATGGGGAGGGPGDSYKDFLRISEWHKSEYKSDLSRKNVVRIWSDLPEAKESKNPWPSSYRPGYPGENFPDNVRWKFYKEDPAKQIAINGLGSPKQAAITFFIPNWFDWHTLKREPNGNGGNPNAYDVILTACSGKGGEGGDFTWIAGGGTQGDYNSLRNKYSVYEVINCKPNCGCTYCCSWGTCGSGSNKYTCCKKNCKGCAPTWTNVCRTSDGTTRFYSCSGKSRLETKGSQSCSSSSSCYYSGGTTKRESEVHDMIMYGGRSGNPPAYNSDFSTTKTSATIEGNNNWVCISVKSKITNNKMTGSVALDPEAATRKYGINNRAALSFRETAIGTAAKGPNRAFSISPVYFTTAVNRWMLGEGGGRGTHGTNGTIQLYNGKDTAYYARVVGGQGGPGACQEWKCANSEGGAHIPQNTWPINPETGARDTCPAAWYCLINTGKGAYLDSHFQRAIEGIGENGYYMIGKGSTIAQAKEQATAKSTWNTNIKDPGTETFDGDTVGYKCTSMQGRTNDATNYCRTGKYNDEYEWTMFKVEKYLAYGDAGQAGQYVNKVVTNKIKGPVNITLGVGGAWKDGDEGWKIDSKSDGPNGEDTIVKGIITAAGGKGGKGALRTDPYHLCSVDDEQISVSVKHAWKNKEGKDDDAEARVCSNKRRIQEGTFAENGGFIQSGTEQATKSNTLLDLNPGKGGNGAGSISNYEYECTPRIVRNVKTMFPSFTGVPNSGAYSNVAGTYRDYANLFSLYNGYVRGNELISITPPVYSNLLHRWSGSPESPKYEARSGLQFTNDNCIGGVRQLGGVTVSNLVNQQTVANTASFNGPSSTLFNATMFNTAGYTLEGTMPPGFSSKYENASDKAIDPDYPFIAPYGYKIGKLANQQYHNKEYFGTMLTADPKGAKSMNANHGAVVITW